MEFDWEINHNDDGYLVTGPDDTILHANFRARRLLGFSAGSPSPPARFRETALSLYRCEPEEAWTEWPVRQERSKEIRYLIRPETSGSPSSWLQVEFSPFSRQIPHQRLIRLHDVTESVSAGCRGWTLRSMIHHRLKSPLASLVTCLEMMNLDRNLLSPEMRELVELSCLSLKRLQQDVIEIQQVGAGRTEPVNSPFRLAELPDLLDRLGTTLQLPRVTVIGFKPAANLTVTISAIAVEGIMAELLKNAVEFHPERTPSVTVAVAVHNAAQLVLQVRDDGTHFTGKQSLIPRYQGRELHGGQGPGRGDGLPVVAALIWESGGSFRLYNREDGPGVVAELILSIICKDGSGGLRN